MKHLTDNSSDFRSVNPIDENLRRLKDLFPDAFLDEGKVDFTILRELLGDNTITGEERYGLNWHGKRLARHLALMPSTGTLLPKPEQSVNWETTRNMFIEGDNLQVLQLLTKSFSGRVGMIYIDPPYNQDADVVYNDDYVDPIQNYKMLVGHVDSDGRELTTARSTSGRLHTKWLQMIYPRLKLAREFLTRDGVIMVSIDDMETAQLRVIMDEVFGAENFIITICWEKGRKNDSTFFSETVEYIHVYARDKQELTARGQWREPKPGLDRVLSYYQSLRTRYGHDHRAIEEDMRAWYDALDPGSPEKKVKHFWRSDNHGLYFGADISSASTSIPDYEVIHPVTGKPCKKPSRGWGCNPDEMKRRIDDDRVHFGDDETTIPLKKSYLEEVDSLVKTPVLYKDGRGASMTVNDLVGRGVFSNPKDHHVLADLISYVSQPDAIVMDFFAGSGSTGHAVWELAASTESRRRFVLVQLPQQLDPDRRDHQAAIAACDALGRPRTIAELTKRRLTRASEDLRRRPSLEHVDLGFRVYELDSSNIREWQPVQEGFLEALAAHVDHIRSDRSEQDILYELLLRRGLDLCVPIETKAIAGNQVHSISSGTLFVCLAVAIAEAESEALAIGIAEWHRELAPVGESAVIFRDSAFADDVVKTNLTAMLEQHGLTNVRSL